MTDKELLELAAKAVGFVPAFNYLPKTNALIWLAKSGTPATWRPLLDSKEAFELSVQLQMDIVFDFDRVMVVFGDADANCITEYFYDLPEPTDRIAATRRAIVRAAAEIGKTL